MNTRGKYLSNLWQSALCSLVLFLSIGCGNKGFEANSSNKTSLNSISDDANLATFKTEVPVSFGLISGIVSEHMTTILAKILQQDGCELAGTPADKRAVDKQYKCGEIPFGKIIGDAKKLVTTFPFSGVRGNSDGVDYTILGANFPMYMTRIQTSGQITISNLDSKKSETFTTSNKIGKQIFVRAAPKAGTLYSVICTALPGFKVYSEETTLKGHLRKETLLFNLDGDITIKVNLGELTFDSANVCAMIEAGVDRVTGKFDIKVVSIENPKLQNVKVNGYRSSVTVDTDGFINSLASILDSFGFSLQKLIENKVKESMDKLAGLEIEKLKNGDIQSGEWLAKYTNAEIFKTIFVNNIADDLAKRLQSNANGESGNLDASEYVSAACVVIVNELQEATQKELGKLYKICRFLPKVSIELFKENNEMNSLGCYQHFFDPMNSKSSNGTKKWWYDSCKLVQEVEIKSPAGFNDLYRCIFKSIETKTSLVTNGCAKLLFSAIDRVSDSEVEELLKQADALTSSSESKEALSRIIALAKDFFGSSLQNFVPGSKP